VRRVSASGLRPLSVGEILDAGLAVYRRHATALWKLVAVVVALPAALDGVVAVAEQQVDDSGGGTSGSLTLLQLLVLVVSVVASFLATGAAYRLVADAYLGRPVDPGASLRFGLQRVGAVLWVSLLAGLGILAGLVLLLVPGIYLAICWSVAVPVLLGENLRGRAALSRSRQLVRGRFWPCLGVLLLTMLLAAILAFVFELVAVAIIGSSDDDTVSFFTQGVASLISNTLVLPFQVAVTTVLYIDLRVRKEGFDGRGIASAAGPEPAEAEEEAEEGGAPG
jgi:hypothetical protein